MKTAFSLVFGVLALASASCAAPLELMLQTNAAPRDYREPDGAISRDGRFRAAPDLAGTAIWDIASGQKRRVLAGNGNPAWSPDGRFLAVAGHDGVRVWEMPAARLRRFEKRGGERVAWDEKSRRFIAFSLNRYEADAWVFDVENPRFALLLNSDLTPVSTFDGPRLSPDGTRAIVCDSRNDHDEKPAVRAEIWNLDSGKIERRWVSSFGVRSARFSPDGRTLAFGQESHNLVLWDSRDNSQRVLVNGPSGMSGYVAISDLAFSPDGTQIVAQTDDERFRVWNVQSGRLERVLPLETRSDLFDFNHFATSREIVDATGAALGPLPLAPPRVSGFAWSRDGKSLLHDGDARLRVWNWRKGNLVAAPAILGGAARLSLGAKSFSALLQIREDSRQRAESW